MSFQFNGLTASVTIGGTVTTTDTGIKYTIPSGATAIQKTYYKQVAGAGGFDVVTPTVSKSLYIVNLSVFGGAGNAFKIGDNITDAIADATEYSNALLGYAHATYYGSVWHFTKPLIISTKLRFYDPAAGAKNWAISWEGWEA